MRRILYSVAMSLDGYIAGPEGEQLRVVARDIIFPGEETARSYTFAVAGDAGEIDESVWSFTTMLTAAFAEEGNMTIEEGGWSNYVEDIREAELALVDVSDPKHDRVTVVDDQLLRRPGRTIEDAALPVRIRVRQWMDNSMLIQADPERPNIATAGIGRNVQALPRPPASGADGMTADSPSAYIELFDGSESLGVYLVNPRLIQPQVVTIDGVDYELALRYERHYKPYTIALLDFTHETFTGTETPRAASSKASRRPS